VFGLLTDVESPEEREIRIKLAIKTLDIEAQCQTFDKWSKKELTKHPEWAAFDESAW
jgi:hypothetical protein